MLYHTDIYINKINILKTFTFTFEFLYFEFLDIFLSTCKRWNSVYELKDVGSLAAGKKCRFILTIFVMISPKDTEHKNYSDDECIDWVYCVNSLFFSLFHSLESLDPVAWEWIIVLFFCILLWMMFHLTFANNICNPPICMPTHSSNFDTWYTWRESRTCFDLKEKVKGIMVQF